ncbi:hypothetical protein D3C83_55280 [compost metagenome]
MLDLECQQHFVEFPRERFFLREKKITRDLHGDGARALAHSTRDEIGQRGARDPNIVDAAVLVESVVFCRENGGNHLFWHLLHRYHRTPLLAEFAN